MWSNRLNATVQIPHHTRSKAPANRDQATQPSYTHHSLNIIVVILPFLIEEGLPTAAREPQVRRHMLPGVQESVSRDGV